MSKATHMIATITPDSPAERAGMVPGENIVAINGHELKDIFDYHYYSDDEHLEILVQLADECNKTYVIDKDLGEDLGITFENGLMDNYRSCHNKCMFCFIDQMPKGMRETLYFKDDDTRLSFLQGNYVTLTNMKDADLQRVIDYHLAPINISVHATNPELRCRMLHNRFAGDILEKIKKIHDAGLEMNSQVVLCKGINDGAELDRTIGELFQFHPLMESLSIVPVGLTKYREGLQPLEPFERDDARAVLEIIEKWQKRSFDAYGDHFVQASDEWYLLAELPLPEAERYDGYIQLENGVGMLRLLLDEFNEALAHAHKFMWKKREVSMATGKLAAPFIEQMSRKFEAKFPKVKIHNYTITNNFFGERITVSGLITGTDLMDQLKGQELGSVLYLPSNMLRMGENVFLDDVTVEQVEDSLQVPIDIVKSSGGDFVDALLHPRHDTKRNNIIGKTES
ncbi:MAG: DUF512 domain-containing protein [Lachnospiraceae bacterium]|nr:DUF512 domain-containing protein [Lachnospiraceae bacterium]